MIRSICLGASVALALAAGAAAAAPAGVKTMDGALADPAGKPLYTWANDTMVGMSHCREDCAKMWPPFLAAKGAAPSGDWTLIKREDGAVQWAYKDKPLYTLADDKAGAAGGGEKYPGWKLAR